jgi:hypothetical protein
MKHVLLMSVAALCYAQSELPDCSNAKVHCWRTARTDAHNSILLVLPNSNPISQLWVVWDGGKKAELYPAADWHQRGDFLEVHPDGGQKDKSLWKKDPHFHAGESFRAVEK